MNKLNNKFNKVHYDKSGKGVRGLRPSFKPLSDGVRHVGRPNSEMLLKGLEKMRLV